MATNAATKARATRASKATEATPTTPKATRASKPKATETAAALPEPEATATRLCRCGCEGEVKGKKAMFVAGHDARMAGTVGRALVGASAAEAEALLATLPSEALQRKARNIGDNHAAKIARRVTVTEVAS